MTRTPVDSDAYHAKVYASVKSIPWRIGNWVGVEVPVPPSAVALLRPNALLGRSYRNEIDGRALTLVVVQCRDTRDMGGHYPPICFPANGWKLLDAERFTASFSDGATLPMTRYLFDRSRPLETTQRWVYNLLLLPEKGGVRDMPDVREAASNQRARRRGAAQIQLVLTGDTPQADQAQIVHEFLGTLRPAIQDIVDFEHVPPHEAHARTH